MRYSFTLFPDVIVNAILAPEASHNDKQEYAVIARRPLGAVAIS